MIPSYHNLITQQVSWKTWLSSVEIDVVGDQARQSLLRVQALCNLRAYMQDFLPFFSFSLGNKCAGEIVLDNEGTMITDGHVFVCNPYGFVVQSDGLCMLLVGLQIETQIVEQGDSLLEILPRSSIVDIAGRFHAFLVVLTTILGVQDCDLRVGMGQFIEISSSYPTKSGQYAYSRIVGVKYQLILRSHCKGIILRGFLLISLLLYGLRLHFKFTPLSCDFVNA